jgi:gamma-glutamyltranspeptidase/glutathione hydrolase
MVVTEDLIATEIGQRILEAGGNAVDAAVAAAFALAVTFPEAGNLGGGGFALYVPHDPSRRPLAIDFREAAPAALRPEMFLGPAGAIDPARVHASGLGVGVPGTVAGLYLLHQEAGSLPWRDLVEPAIRQARAGKVGASLHWRLADPECRARIEAGGGGPVYYPGGAVPEQTAALDQSALAGTLSDIAELGPAAFYGGPAGQAIVDEVARRGGVLTAADLAGYRAVAREPLRGWFRGNELFTMPPPSSGGVVVLQALSILDGFPLDQEREAALAARGETAGPGISGRAVHWWIEALRLAFADRAAHLGDPDFVAVPVDALLSPDWVAKRRISIGEQANPGVGPMPVSADVVEGADTTHLVVLDRAGNAVSLTTTLNSNFGTGIYVPAGGFFLNDELDDFALQPGTPNQFDLVGSEANALEPRKRPLSSMTPIIMRDGGNAVTLVLGARGGPRIITSVFLTILRLEVYGQSLAEAQRSPRLHQQWSPARTLFEPGWDPLVLQELRNRGHEVVIDTSQTAGLQALRLRVGGEPEGVPDPRTPMAAAGGQDEEPQLSRDLHAAADPRWGRAARGPGRAIDWEPLAEPRQR